MSTIDMGELRDATTTVLVVLMFIGGASTSVAGGIKMGSFMVAIAVVVSSMRGRQQTQAFGREIPEPIVLRAIAVVALGLMTLAVGVWALELSDDVPFVSGVFETMSALANVGWSHGVTPSLTTTGAMILVVLMYLGSGGTVDDCVECAGAAADDVSIPIGGGSVLDSSMKLAWWGQVSAGQ